MTLVRSYLSNRKQRVKLGPHHSEWANTSKGVPQGSILGPLLFNIFINDIFNVLNKSTLYNYADDNTLWYSHHNAETLIQVLQCDCSAILQWFNRNQMKANPDKFQSYSFGKRGNRDIRHFTCDSMYVSCEDSVSLLGVNFDHLLTFNNHITEICKKSSQTAGCSQTHRPLPHCTRKINDLQILHYVKFQLLPLKLALL